MHRRTAAGGEFLSTSESLFLSAAAFGYVSCFMFWAAAILKLLMNQELYRTWQHQRDHAQHTKEMGTLEQRRQGLYCLALPIYPPVSWRNHISLHLCFLAGHPSSKREGFAQWGFWKAADNFYLFISELDRCMKRVALHAWLQLYETC